MAKYLYNTTQQEIIIKGKSIPAEDYYFIQATLEAAFSADSQLLSYLANGDLILSKSEDLTGHITDLNSAIDYLKNNLPIKVESANLPFGSKILADGSKIFRRVRGISASIQNTSINIDFTIPFTKCKITGLQILNATLGSKATFQVLDTAEGLISGYPNAVLNTFGQDVYVEPGSASYPSKYDADLIIGMKLRIVYDSADEVLNPYRVIYVNFDLHEVKDP